MTKRIIIGGASGLVGTALVSALRQRGDQVRTLVRREARDSSEIEWHPDDERLDPASLAHADAVVLLNGASVGRMPWTASYRETLLRSRIEPTRTVVDALLTIGADAPRLLSGSAVGFYGSGPGEELTEASPAGDTFLAELCVQWEAEAQRAASVTGVSLLRTAPVIHRQGVLRPMIALTALGLGGPLGAGKQVWPWISLDDEVGAILHVLDHGLTGPVNLCGPTTATANQIGRALARGMRRPFWLPAPAWALRVALGRHATESLLTSDSDVRPLALQRSGYLFRHERAEAAVINALQR